MEEGWIALEGAQEAINSEKEITFDRSTLNSISPERKNREWDNRVRDARWRGRVEEEEREREGEEKWTKLERGGRWARRCEWIVPVGRSRVPWRAAGLVHGCVSCRAAVHRGTRWDDVYVRRRCG